MAALEDYSTKTVLAIDDNEKFLKGVQTYLSDAGLTDLKFAYDGIEGIKLALEEEPDLILLDIEMPGLDGFEVMRRLRSEGLNSKVVIFSVNNNAEAGMMAQTLGASDFIPKADFFDVAGIKIKNSLEFGRGISDSVKAPNASLISSFELLSKIVSDLDDPETALDEIDRVVAELRKGQGSSQSISKSLETIRDIGVGASGNLAANGILGIIEALAAAL